MQTARLSVITAIKPNQLSKGFSLGANGDLLKSPGGNLVEGKLETRTLENLPDFAAILQSLTPAQALVYGVEPPHLNWSTVMFRRRRTRNGEQAAQARGNSSEAAAG